MSNCHGTEPGWTSMRRENTSIHPRDTTIRSLSAHSARLSLDGTISNSPPAVVSTTSGAMTYGDMGDGDPN